MPSARAAFVPASSMPDCPPVRSSPMRSPSSTALPRTSVMKASACSCDMPWRDRSAAVLPATLRRTGSVLDSRRRARMVAILRLSPSSSSSSPECGRSKGRYSSPAAVAVSLSPGDVKSTANATVKSAHLAFSTVLSWNFGLYDSITVSPSLLTVLLTACLSSSIDDANCLLNKKAGRGSPLPAGNTGFRHYICTPRLFFPLSSCF